MLKAAESGLKKAKEFCEDNLTEERLEEISQAAKNKKKAIKRARNRLKKSKELYEEALADGNLYKIAKAAKNMFRQGKSALEQKIITEDELQDLHRILMNVLHRIEKEAVGEEGVRAFINYQKAKLLYPYKKQRYKRSQRSRKD